MCIHPSIRIEEVSPNLDKFSGTCTQCTEYRIDWSCDLYIPTEDKDLGDLAIHEGVMEEHRFDVGGA